MWGLLVLRMGTSNTPEIPCFQGLFRHKKIIYNCPNI